MRILISIKKKKLFWKKNQPMGKKVADSKIGKILTGKHTNIEMCNKDGSLWLPLIQWLQKSVPTCTHVSAFVSLFLKAQYLNTLSMPVQIETNDPSNHSIPMMSPPSGGAAAGEGSSPEESSQEGRIRGKSPREFPPTELLWSHLSYLLSTTPPLGQSPPPLTRRRDCFYRRSFVLLLLLQEAASLISQRAVNPRDMFKQRERGVTPSDSDAAPPSPQPGIPRPP